MTVCKRILAAGLVYLGLLGMAAAQIKPPGYAVASAHPLATEAGLAILTKGGNAFDAAVAVSAVLAVVEPYHSGLGGGGFWLLHLANNNQDVFIDSREVAPLAAHEAMYQDKQGRVVPGLSLNGALAAAIPGTPAGMAYVAEHYGRLGLAADLAPAIQLAEKGFPMDSRFYSFVLMDDRLSQLQRFPASAAIFLNQGKPWQPGELFIQTDLAKTLRHIAKDGAKGFYQGEVAKQLVAAVRAEGGIWTEQDLASYRVKRRKPLVGQYGNMQIITAPPPSAGGFALITMLNILSGYTLSPTDPVQWVHHLAEAMRLAYWQRVQFAADPDFVEVPLDYLLSMANARQLRRYIKPNQASPSETLPSHSSLSGKQQHTTHFSILDAEGNRVAATMTVNYIFGSSLVAKGTGVLLNDEMDDFSAKPGVKNVFGLVGSGVNSIAPGKRPVSSMTPTFLLMPGRVAILGTPGGSRIPTMVLLAALRFAQGEGAISMVSTMRFHHQYLPDWLQVEPETWTPAMKNSLKSMGYQIMQLKQYYGDMQAVTWDQDLGIITAASDPRAIGMSVVKIRQEAYGLEH